MPQLTSGPDEAATNFYVNLVRKYGEPGASNDGFTECLNDFDAGKAAMWYDATVAAGLISTNTPKILRQHRLRLRPHGPRRHPFGLAVHLVIGHTHRYTQQGRQLEVPVVGYRSPDPPRTGSQVRLGRGQPGHPHVVVQEPELPESGWRLLRDHAELDRRRQP